MRELKKVFHLVLGDVRGGIPHDRRTLHGFPQSQSVGTVQPWCTQGDTQVIQFPRGGDRNASERAQDKVEALGCHPSGITEHSLAGKTQRSKLQDSQSRFSEQSKTSLWTTRSQHSCACMRGGYCCITGVHYDSQTTEASARKQSKKVQVSGQCSWKGQRRLTGTKTSRCDLCTSTLRVSSSTLIGSGLGGDSSVSLHLRTETSFYRVQRQDCKVAQRWRCATTWSLPSKVDFLRNSQTPPAAAAAHSSCIQSSTSGPRTRPEPSCPAALRHWVSPSPTETTWEGGLQRTVIAMRGLRG